MDRVQGLPNTRCRTSLFIKKPHKEFYRKKVCKVWFFIKRNPSDLLILLYFLHHQGLVVVQKPKVEEVEENFTFFLTVLNKVKYNSIYEVQDIDYKGVMKNAKGKNIQHNAI